VTAASIDIRSNGAARLRVTSSRIARPFRGVLLRHRVQGLEQALPVLELGPRRRIGGQPRLELARLGVARFAVEDGVHQLGERGVLQGHLTSNP
jgi:hypothetical protein